MKREELRAELEANNVESSIIKTAFSAYDYLREPAKCLSGADYAHRIAADIFGEPTMAWSISRPETEIALSLLEDRGIVQRRGSDRKYIVAKVLEE